MGTKIVQHNIFGEMEEIRTKKTRKEIFEDYDGFVDKFKPKLTTDDCYTPQYVYDVIRDWVDENVIPLEGKRVVRPFYPGGDYRNFDYSGDCFVLDNPPFSILAEIRDFYAERNIGYFLFAPALTLFSRLGKNEDNVTFIVAAAMMSMKTARKSAQASSRTGCQANCASPYAETSSGESRRQPTGWRA